MKITKAQRKKAPWFMIRDKCIRCGGFHAPWWRIGQAPSCMEGSDRQNGMVMYLEMLKATGR